MKRVIGLFDDTAQAAKAETAATGLGNVKRLSGVRANGYDTLKGYGVTGRELDGFCEGIRRGGTLIVAECDDARAPQIAEIFRTAGTVDIDKRMNRWQSSGWKGYDQQSSFLGSQEIEQERLLGKNELHIPVIQETIAIGKREVESGGVRVETHVREQPVHESVALHEEKISVERHKVDRPAVAGDRIGDRVVEMRAKSEEAVVAKAARVVEEVVVKKDETTRQQQINDTVKTTDVEVKPIAAKSTERTTERTSRSSVDRVSHPSRI